MGLGGSFPTIRIDIEGVRHTLIHSLHSSLEADRAAVEKQVNEQLKALDINRLVEEVVKTHAPKIITEAVVDNMRRAVSEALWTDEGRGMLTAAIGNMARKSLRKMARTR